MLVALVQGIAVTKYFNLIIYNEESYLYISKLGHMRLRGLFVSSYLTTACLHQVPVHEITDQQGDDINPFTWNLHGPSSKLCTAQVQHQIRDVRSSPNESLTLGSCFCRHQAVPASPHHSHITPVPRETPGYTNPLPPVSVT